MSNPNVLPLNANLTVDVCKGDITTDTSDVIINGVNSTLFDLSAGEFFLCLR